jgi:hypothetical protein
MSEPTTAPVVDAPAAAEPSAAAPAAPAAVEPTAPVEAPAPAAEPVVEAAPEPSAADFDFKAWDYRQRDYDAFPEAARPWLKGAHERMLADLIAQEEASAFDREMYNSLVSGQDAESLPATAKMRQELESLREASSGHEKRYQELQAEFDAYRSQDIKRQEADVDRRIDSFVTEHGETLRQAGPDAVAAFTAITCDLEDGSGRLYFEGDMVDAMQIAVAGQGDQLKAFADRGVPYDVAVEYLAMKRGSDTAPEAPKAPPRPKPAHTAEVMAGADGTETIAQDLPAGGGDGAIPAHIPKRMRSVYAAVDRASKRKR